jgi:hypothetical protein
MIFSYRGHRVIEHGGSLPGQRSTIIRAPDDGFGIAVTVNDDDFGTQFAEVVRNTVMDQLLGLKGIDWEERIMGKMLGGAKIPVALPEKSRDVPGYEVLSGEYKDEGYGTINLQLLNASHALYNTITNPPAAGLNVTGPIYYSDFDKVFSTHIIFTPFDGPILNWTVTSLQEVRDENGRTGEYVGQSFGNSGSAVWTEEGIGMFGNFWGAGEMVGGVEAEERDVKGRAEVWFGRV